MQSEADPEDPDQTRSTPAIPSRAPAVSFAAPVFPCRGRAPSRAAVAAAFAAVYLIWGSTYLAIRIGVETIPPFLLGGSRFVMAGAVLYFVFRVRGAPAPSRAQWRHAAASGVLMLALGNGLVTWAEQEVPSNIAALLIAGTPLYVALLDWARPGGVRPSFAVFMGIGLGAAGLALLVGQSGGHGGAHGASLGSMLAVVLGSVSWSLGVVYMRTVAQRPHAGLAAAQQMIAGGLAMLLASALRDEPVRQTLARLSWEGTAVFAYLTVFGSIVAFSAFTWLLRVTSLERVSTTAYVNPLVAVILGWAMLGETLGPRAFAGAVVILAAVVVMTVGPTWQARRAEARLGLGR